MCSHQKENTCVLFCYFLWRLQKERPCGRGSHLFARWQRRLWDGAGSSSGFCRCFCVSCVVTVPCHSLTRFCVSWDIIQLCLRDTTNDCEFNLSISQLFLLTPSRWCHHVVHLFERFLIGGFLCFFRGQHMSYYPAEFLCSLFFPLRFFPYVLNITPEGIYTFKFSLFPSYHLIGLQYKYLGKKAKILIVNFGIYIITLAFHVFWVKFSAQILNWARIYC